MIKASDIKCTLIYKISKPVSIEGYGKKLASCQVSNSVCSYIKQQDQQDQMHGG